MAKMQSELFYSSKSNEHETPQWLFRELDLEFNFTLDPCCTHENAKCEKHYTKKENGLEQDWSNEIVFMNPPYGRNIDRWMKKAYLESKKGATVVCLVYAKTDTIWWHDWAVKGKVRYIKGRLKFGSAKAPAPFGSAIVIFKEN